VKYFSKENYGIWRFSSEEDLKRLTKGLKLPEIALMCNIGKIDEDDFCPREETILSLVRVVADREKVSMALEIMEKIKKKGYEVSLNVTGFSNFTDSQIGELVGMLNDYRPDYVYVADTYGSMFPDQLPRLLEPLMGISGVKVGFHPHNNLQMAFVNTLEAIKLGVDVVDASVFGMGRGAGNLPMEVILNYLQGKRKDKYNVIPVLDFLDQNMMPLHKKIGWGYSLPYFLSGVFKCHPYYVRDIMNHKRFTVDEMWNILDIINKKDTSTYVAGMVDDIIESHHIGWIAPTEKGQSPLTHKITASDAGCQQGGIPYLNRHHGRNFLILANGPTLKSYQKEINHFIKKHNPVVMGANNLGGLYTPDYHAFTLTKRFKKYHSQISEKSKILVGGAIPSDIVKTHILRDYETIYYNDVLSKDFNINNGVVSTNCRSISVLLTAIAITMGAEKIFVAGMDGYLGAKNEGSFYFYNETEDIEDEELIIDRHKWSQYFISVINDYLVNDEKDGIKIITPTSYSMFYSGIDNYL